jgi:hypothetical protein
VKTLLFSFCSQKEKRASSRLNTYNPPQTPPFEKEGLVVAIGNPACGRMHCKHQHFHFFARASSIFFLPTKRKEGVFDIRDLIPTILPKPLRLKRRGLLLP